MNQPWWVTYIFLGSLILAAFIFTMQGRMTPAEFLAFSAALGFRAPNTSSDRQATQVDVQGEDVTVTESD